jgi:hypothetical protein
MNLPRGNKKHIIVVYADTHNLQCEPAQIYTLRITVIFVTMSMLNQPSIQFGPNIHQTLIQLVLEA